MDGEISSIRCSESAGCAVHLIAPLTDRSYHKRTLRPMRYGQFGSVANLGCRVAENVVLSVFEMVQKISAYACSFCMDAFFYMFVCIKLKG